MTFQPAALVLDASAAAQLFDSLFYPNRGSPEVVAAVRKDALGLLAELAPRDRMQAALAVRVVALLHATMAHFATAARVELSPELMTRLSGKAMAASRMADQTRHALRQLQAMPNVEPAVVPEAIMRLAAELPMPALAAGEAPASMLPPDSVEAASGVEGEAGLSALAPTPAQPPATGWVVKRQQELAEKMARGGALTPAQQEWLRKLAAKYAVAEDLRAA